VIAAALVLVAGFVTVALVGFVAGYRAAVQERPAHPTRLDVCEPPAHFEAVRRVAIFDYEADR
jgi:hypothetical protein